jgi:hypothetical protein
MGTVVLSLSAALLPGCKPGPSPLPATAVTPPSPPSRTEESALDRARRELRQSSIDQPPDPLPLLETCSRLGEKTGWIINADPSLQKENPRIVLQETASPLKLDKALDWICRQADARYQIVSDREVVISRSPASCRTEPISLQVYDLGPFLRPPPAQAPTGEVVVNERWTLPQKSGSTTRTTADPFRYLQRRIEAVDAKIAPTNDRQEAEKRTLQEMKRFLNEALLPVLAPGRGGRLHFHREHPWMTGSLPLSAHRRMQAMLNGLTAPPVARAVSLPEAIRTTVSGTYRRHSLHALLEELSRQSPIPVGFDPRALPDPPVTIAWKAAPLAEAIRMLGEVAGIPLAVSEEGEALWVHPSYLPAPPRSMEHPWDGLETAIYPVPQRGAQVSPEVLTALLKEQSGGTRVWEEPGAALLHHGPTGRLVAVHRPEVQDRIAQILPLLRADARGRLQIVPPEKE